MFPQTINAMYQFYENEIGKQQSRGDESSQYSRQTVGHAVLNTQLNT